MYASLGIGIYGGVCVCVWVFVVKGCENSYCLCGGGCVEVNSNLVREAILSGVQGNSHEDGLLNY